jgi:hypothetical protein
MILDVHVSGRLVAKLYRERYEFLLRYLPETVVADFFSFATSSPSSERNLLRDICET